MNRSVSFTDTDDWDGGYVAQLSIATQGSDTLQGWTVGFDLAEDITQIWGATIISHVGTHYVVQNVGYNTNVTASNPAGFGYVATGSTPVAPSSFTLNNAALSPSAPAAVAVSTPAPTTTPTPAPTQTTTPAPTQTVTPTPAPAAASPSVSVETATVTAATGETFTASGNGTLLPSGYLSTSGATIVDSSGHAVSINAINWFGMETSTFAPQGLWAVNYQDTMKQMVALGFNTIRIPFSDQAFDPASVPNGIDFSLNPDLKGLNALQILDKIVAEASTLGLKIILDHHSSSAGGGPNASGLWYDSTYNQATFTSNWVSLASHYAGNSTVIGVDLANEPHGQATWGDGNTATDWEMAATATGDAVQAVNPNLLVIVEGTQNNNGVSTAWGENLTGVAAHPVVLNTANKLVYSVHDYPSSVTGNTAFDDPTTLAATWTRDWGYIQQQNIAPVWIGEFGSKLATTADQNWLNTLVQYIDGNAAAGTGGAAVAQPSFSWAYWDWNPNSGDTGGILLDDWKTVNQTKIAAIQPAFWTGSTTAPSSDATFMLDLSTAATSDITVHVQTKDGTAVAGKDYTAVSEDVVFHAGDTHAAVSVHLLSNTASASSVFFLQITDATGATISTQQGSATLGTPAAASTTPTTTASTTTSTTTTPTTTSPTVTPVVTQPTTTPAPSTTPPATTTPAASTTTTTPAPSTTPTTPAPTTTTPPPNTTPTTPAPVTAVAGNASISDVNDWGSGLTANVNVTSAGGGHGWQVEIDTTEVITNLWNGTILSHTGNTYVVAGAGWNADLSAGGSASFGFQASHTTASDSLVAQFVKFSG